MRLAFVRHLQYCAGHFQYLTVELAPFELTPMVVFASVNIIRDQRRRIFSPLGQWSQYVRSSLQTLTLRKLSSDAIKQVGSLLFQRFDFDLVDPLEKSYGVYLRCSYTSFMGNFFFANRFL